MEIGAFEAKNRLGMLLDRVEQGEELLITRHGKPVARLDPSTTRIQNEEACAALRRIRQRAVRLNQPFDWAQVKAEREEGR
jgi:prevent-host-death family protein